MGTPTAATIRLGHAFPHPKSAQSLDPVDDLLALINGLTPIGPRAPQDGSVVWLAESLLKIERDHRPVYAYVGYLHPELGTIGLVLRPSWLTRAPHGVSRCDTGGLAGCLGGFSAITSEEAKQAVVSLSLPIDDSWSAHLEQEINSAHPGGWINYLQGNPPTPDQLPDVRGLCLKHLHEKGGTPDPRLWTWEARSFAHIELADVEAIVLSPEATKNFYNRMLTSGTTLPSARVIVGRATPDGVHYFHEDAVLRAFRGEAS
jgi:hypothetical protein